MGDNPRAAYDETRRRQKADDDWLRREAWIHSQNPNQPMRSDITAMSDYGPDAAMATAQAPTFSDSLSSALSYGQTLGGKRPGEAAGDTGMLRAAGDWAPGFGDVTAGADFMDAANNNDALGMSLAAAGFVLPAVNKLGKGIRGAVKGADKAVEAVEAASRYDPYNPRVINRNAPEAAADAAAANVAGSPLDRLKDTKIRTPEGNPLQVYHGTTKEFDQFDPENGAFYFSRDPKYAAGAERGFLDPEDFPGIDIPHDVPEGLNIRPSYLDLKNPASLDDITAHAPDAANIRAAIPALREKGFDGIDIGHELIAFNPSQIHSAIDVNAERNRLARSMQPGAEGVPGAEPLQATPGFSVGQDLSAPGVGHNRMRDQLSHMIVPDDPANMTPKGKDPEYYHAIGGGNKLPVPLSKMTAEYQDNGLAIPQSWITPEDIPIGSTLMPLYGDRTIAGKTLLSVNGRDLVRPQELGGGANFMRDNPGSIWASDKGIITSLLNKARKYGEKGDVYGIHTSMGAPGGDFARMTTRPLLDWANKGKDIDPNVVSLFDAEMTDKIGDKWPGLANADDEWLARSTGGQRAFIPKLMLKKSYQDAGFPDVASLRKAITEPDLLNRKMLTGGRTVGKFDPSFRSILDPEKVHDTYNTHAAGNYVGDLGAMPQNLLWHDFMQTMPPHYTEQNLGQFFQTNGVSQEVTAEWQDRLMNAMTGRER